MKIPPLLLVASALGLLINTAALGVTWTGEGPNKLFASPQNWDNGEAPGDTEAVYEITNGDTVELNRNSKIGRLLVNGGSVLNIRRGQHRYPQTGRSTYNLYFHKSGGTINHFNVRCEVGHGVVIGSGNADGGGTYNLMGGSLVVYRGSASLIAEKRPGFKSFSLEIGDTQTGGTALLDITGRAQLTTRTGVSIGPNGTFSVTGADVKIEIGRHKDHDGSWSQLAGGTLRSLIDKKGVTPVRIADVDDAGGTMIQFQPGSLLELGFGEGSDPRAGSWVIFEAENTPFDAATVAGLALSPAVTDANWSFAAETRDEHGVIVATYTLPEEAEAEAEEAEPEEAKLEEPE